MHDPMLLWPTHRLPHGTVTIAADRSIHEGQIEKNGLGFESDGTDSGVDVGDEIILENPISSFQETSSDDIEDIYEAFGEQLARLSSSEDGTSTLVCTESMRSARYYINQHLYAWTVDSHSSQEGLYRI